MKLFIIIPTLKQGGAERVSSELASHFSNKGVEVHLVLLAQADNFYEVANSVHIHRLGFVNHGKLKKVISEIKVFFKLRSLLRQYKPDSVLSFMDKFNIFTILASLFLNLKVFISDRSNPNLKLSPLLLISKKILYPLSYGIIAQTTLAKDTLLGITNHNNIVVIPNPVKEVRLFPNIKKEKIILNVGRLVDEKGQKYLLEAFSKLNLQDWKLVILGDGPLRKDLENLILTLGLTNNVVLPGAVNNIDEWFAKSSIFAFTSISEGFPNALIEAMAAGLPCVSFDCEAGPGDIIENGINGFLVEERNISELVEKIQSLIDDPILSEKISKNAINVRERYNLNSIGSKYFSFIINK